MGVPMRQPRPAQCVWRDQPRLCVAQYLDLPLQDDGVALGLPILHLEYPDSLVRGARSEALGIVIELRIVLIRQLRRFQAVHRPIAHDGILVLCLDWDGSCGRHFAGSA
jgi:hypothetical protein